MTNLGGKKHARAVVPEGPGGGGGVALPLRVGLIVFVSLVFDHPEAADADVWSGHLHPIQGDPAGGKRREEEGGGLVPGNTSGTTNMWLFPCSARYAVA